MKDTRFRSAFSAGAVTPHDILAFHRVHFGAARMEDDEGAPPERPDGVTEEEWTALGDPGKRAIVRERARATKAEQEAAALRAPKPAPPKTDDKAGQQGDKDSPPAPDPTDIAAIVQQAVAAALKPIQERDEQRTAVEAAQKVAEAVTDAAKERLHDASDALVNVDLTTLTDGNGKADAAKITQALDDLVKTKPHLAKVTDTTRRPGADAMLGGATAPVSSEDDRVKAALAKMQVSAGVKLAGA